MAVSHDDVRHIAALARLAVPAERLDSLAEELSGILVHIDALSNATLDAVASNASDAAGEMPLAPDVHGSVPLERPIADFAPSMRDGFFLVPRLATHGDAGESADDGHA